MKSSTAMVLIGVVLVALVLLGGWYFLSRGGTQQVLTPEAQREVEKMTDEAKEDLSNAATMAAEIAGSWKVPLGEQNESAETGLATLVDKDGQVEVTLTMVTAPGATVSASQPAHIHVGSCPNPGAVKFPLSDVVDGKSVTLVNTTLADLKSMLPLSINVHRSKADLKFYMACGDLK